MSEETIIVYAKENDYEFKTKVISSEEQIPNGWVDDPEKLSLKVKKSEFSRLTDENLLLNDAVTELAEVLNNQDIAITDLAQTISDLAEGGALNG